MTTTSEIFNRFQDWARSNEEIKAAVLTGSRVIPGARVDFLSDYDIELYVKDLDEFTVNDDWLEALGPVMVRWPFTPRSTGYKKGHWITRLALFKNGERLDLQITDQGAIDPDDYDNGFQVLIDKTGITRGLNPPTYSRFTIKKPGETEFTVLVNEFWWNAHYVPKYLWREELPFARYMLDVQLRYSFLHQIIDWYIGMQNGWSVATGPHGRKFKDFLDTATWAELEKTYAGADLQETWSAFFHLVALFRRLALETGNNLGYKYPLGVDNEVMQFCHRIKEKEDS